MCKNQKCQCGEECKKTKKVETFQKTKEDSMNSKKQEQIKPKNDGKETFGI